MRKITFAFLFILLIAMTPIEAAEEATSKNLLHHAAEYDGEDVILEGEVIGDILAADKENVWINVRDDASAIGVFCPKEFIDKIEHLGNYKTKGDIVSVRGVFHRACSAHGGDTDIHAEKLSIKEMGEKITHSLDPPKVRTSIILPIAALLLAIIHLIVRRFR